jgi:cation transport protein ChaC
VSTAGPAHALTREALKAGWLQEQLRRSAAPGLLLSDAQLSESREAALRLHPPGQDLWLFAYGSLIWNPAFHFAERTVGRLRGWHRRFCLWTHLGRGTPENPGLMLGLDRGGACTGLLYRIRAEEVPCELEIVWRREMVTAAYRPHWVAATGGPGCVRALTFVINRTHERYAGRLDDLHIIRAIATAEGPMGRCADYLFHTAEHLAELGLADRTLERLARAVRTYRAAHAEPDRGPPAG